MKAGIERSLGGSLIFGTLGGMGRADVIEREGVGVEEIIREELGDKEVEEPGENGAEGVTAKVGLEGGEERGEEAGVEGGEGDLERALRNKEEKIEDPSLLCVCISLSSLIIAFLGTVSDKLLPPLLESSSVPKSVFVVLPHI